MRLLSHPTRYDNPVVPQGPAATIMRRTDAPRFTPIHPQSPIHPHLISPSGYIFYKVIKNIFLIKVAFYEPPF